MPTAVPNILIFSADAERLAGLRGLVRTAAPGWRLVEATNVADAALAGAGAPLAVAVLDHAAASPLSPLVRVLRRQSPHIKVLVFAVGVAPAEAQVHPWDELPERLGRAVRRAGAVS